MKNGDFLPISRLLVECQVLSTNFNGGVVYVDNCKRRLRLYQWRSRRREQLRQNLVVCIYKSEAEVTNNKN